MSAIAPLSRPYPACWDWQVPAHDYEGWIDDGVAIDLLTRFHAGQCALCGAFESFAHRRGGLRSDLVTDHCHVWNTVRGFLCKRCNSIEGHKAVARAVRLYRSCSPVDLLGVRVPYSHDFTRARAVADDIRASNYSRSGRAQFSRPTDLFVPPRVTVVETRYTDDDGLGDRVRIFGLGGRDHELKLPDGSERWYSRHERVVAYCTPDRYKPRTKALPVRRRQTERLAS